MEEKDDFTFSIEGKDYTISEKKSTPEKNNKQTLHAPSLGIGAIIAGICIAGVFFGLGDFSESAEPLIEKQWASAFHKTDLDQQLKSLGVDSLVITGLTTSGCVRATAVDGLQHEFQVVIAEEAVGDRNQDAHKANLFDLDVKYADVQSVDQILKQLL